MPEPLCIKSAGLSEDTRLSADLAVFAHPQGVEVGDCAGQWCLSLFERAVCEKGWKESLRGSETKTEFLILSTSKRINIKMHDSYLFLPTRPI